MGLYLKRDKYRQITFTIFYHCAIEFVRLYLDIARSYVVFSIRNSEHDNETEHAESIEISRE